MISKETQYRIYAGTKKDDFTGWQKADIDPDEHGDVELWSLSLGNGYYLDRVAKEVKGLFRHKVRKLTSIRRDYSVEDPDGDYADMDFHILYDINIQVSNDAIKFDGKNNSFVILSREPIDWNEFSKGVPQFDDKEVEQNWSSFYC